MAEHNDTGRQGEQLAKDHLRSKGYTIRDTNWRSGHREIDIVALSPDMRTTVFVEVKTRSAHPLVAPETAIDRQKVCNLGRVADAYIKQNKIVGDVRFDVITIVEVPGESVPRVEHWEDAFDPMLAY